MSYYYLISSLPDLSIGMDTKQIDFEKTFDLIQRNLTPEDNELFQYLIYPNDISTLLSILFHEYHQLPLFLLKKVAVYSEEEVREYRFFKSNFPDFLNDFLVENEARFPTMTMQEMEEKLMANFYEEVANLNNPFITEYFHFLKKLKNLGAAFNYSAYKFLSAPLIKDSERLVGQIGPNSSPTATLTKDYPYVEEFVKVLSGGKPEKIENFIDRILWDFLEDNNKSSFSREEVFTYTLKLQMIQRWSLLDFNEGSKRFKKLHKDIISNVQFPKASMI